MNTREDVPILTTDFTVEMMDSPHENTCLEPWIENLSDFAWVFDRDFRCVRIDPRVVDLSRREDQDSLGRLAWEAFPDLAETLWANELRKTLEEGSSRRFEFFHPTWKLWLDCRSFLDGKHLCVVANDLTSLKKSEAAMKEARQELEAFSYSIAHDMRAPLRAMQSFARILQQDFGAQLNSESADCVRRIVSASERLDQLIRDALAYSQLSQVQLPLAPVNLSELLREILESYPEFQEPPTAVSVLSALPTVLGNAAALTQCLANLIDNGIKFSKPGESPRLEIWAEPCGSRIRIHIKDQGIGIDPAYHQKIFHMFYQHDPSYPGTGIGLVVVRKAAEKMKGNVGIESELGKGSDFYLELEVAE